MSRAGRRALALDRRTFLRSAAGAAFASLLLPRLGLGEEAGRGLELGPPAPFAFDALVAEARRRAARAYVPPPRPAPAVVERIDYERHGELRFRRRHALFRTGDAVHPVTFFPLGRYFASPVRIHALADGTAREVLYSPSLFEIPEASPARELPEDAGFAGFRLHEARDRADWRTQDWAAFLGASYFRAIGALGQYGLSARGVAVDTATDAREEFPRFESFWIEAAEAEDEPVLVHALLDGPSVAGAFRLALRRDEAVVMDVEARLFLRRDVERLGLAPLTSMFWYAEHGRPEGVDWRPEVHDSDGLVLWTGAGERIWRPLRNPRSPSVSTFEDRDPRGFALAQRDRDVEHYLDGVRYDLRPAVWVEPKEPWGRGSVQLVELPTDDEIHDNIVAFWVPAAPARAGGAYRVCYRLHWVGEIPDGAEGIARVVATRTGRGGEPGTPRPEGVRKFVVEFAGPALDGFGEEDPPEAVIDASRGRVLRREVERVPGTARWRAVFDLAAEGGPPVELRLFLQRGEHAVSETWLFRYEPPGGAPARGDHSSM